MAIYTESSIQFFFSITADFNTELRKDYWKKFNTKTPIIHTSKIHNFAYAQFYPSPPLSLPLSHFTLKAQATPISPTASHLNR
jgi:hypothetical protein